MKKNPKEYLKKQSPFLGSEVIGDNIPQPAYDLMPIVITSIVSGVTPVQLKKWNWVWTIYALLTANQIIKYFFTPIEYV